MKKGLLLIGSVLLSFVFVPTLFAADIDVQRNRVVKPKVSQRYIKATLVPEAKDILTPVSSELEQEVLSKIHVFFDQDGNIQVTMDDGLVEQSTTALIEDETSAKPKQRLNNTVQYVF